jgi:hypothetical protein
MKTDQNPRQDELKVDEVPRGEAVKKRPRWQLKASMAKASHRVHLSCA